MANKTNLSSWRSLKSYLTGNIDSTRDWDNIDLKDYTALSDAYSQGIITGDKLAEGKTLFQNYLADAQAADTYAAAQAKAENTARQENAYSNYLNTRLGSYLGELQSNAGQKGYVGTVQGQAVAVKNAQENAYQQTAENKRTSLSDMLATYQQALSDNSAEAIDQQTKLQSSRDAKRDTDLANYKLEVDKWFDGDGMTEGALVDGVLPADKQKDLQSYLAGISDESMRSELQNYIDFAHGGTMSKTQTVTNPDGTTSEQVVAPDNKVSAVKTKLDTDLAAISGTDSYNAIKATIENNKEVLGSEYQTYLDNLNKKMSDYIQSHYEVKGLGTSLSNTDDFSLVIDGKKFDLTSGKRTDGMDYALNTKATGNKDLAPKVGTIIEYSGDLYVYKKSRYGENWHKVERDKSKVSDAVAQWNKYSS